MKSVLILFLFITLFLTSGCGGVTCKLIEKGEEKTVVLAYDPLLKYVQVGGQSYVQNKNSPWVKKVIVESEGFVVVFEQKTAGFKKRPCDDDPSKLCEKHTITSYYILQTYTETEGYKYWFKIPKEEWELISNLTDRPSKKPDLQTNDCSFSSFASFLSDLIGILRI